MRESIIEKYEIVHSDIVDYIDFLSKDFVNLPIIQSDDDVYFIDLINKLFQNYQRELGRIAIFPEDYKEKVSALSSSIEKSLKAYYSGQPAEAYGELEEGLNAVIDKIFHAKLFRNMIPKNLYRMRVGLNKSYSRGEMFHIPFEKRGMATTQRYSIPGLPCLYLGESIYVCWEELKRPDLHYVHGSKFTFTDEIKDKLNILYFGLTPKMFAHEISQEYKYRTYVSVEKYKRNLDEAAVLELKEILESYIILWPLMMSCSIKVRNTNDIFKPEYIVPQLLLQWVTNRNDYQGICYFSVNTSHSTDNYLLNQNIVIPVKSVNKKGYCTELMSMFKLTNSAPWQIFNINSMSYIENEINRREGIILEKKDILPRSEMKIGLSSADSKYSRTQFGMFEEFLNCYELDMVDNSSSCKNS
ncbi:hypothetical protein [Paenibacillus glycanilyticus]|uniref:hypothetical protein n=1 Tax=Paenibacillus glycanilyticus TaxID=126569 RepID=UPI000FD96CCF|nr:hypothetical protein [Paenibacillus glycanilyticus]